MNRDKGKFLGPKIDAASGTLDIVANEGVVVFTVESGADTFQLRMTPSAGYQVGDTFRTAAAEAEGQNRQKRTIRIGDKEIRFR